MAVGAISHYIDHPVISRIVRYTYGTDSFIDYDHSDPEHRSRAHKKYLGILGKMVLDVFSPTLVKVILFVFGLRTGDKRIFRVHGY